MAKDKIIIAKAKDGKPYVKVKAGNNETLVSSETFSSLAAARKNAGILQKRMISAEIIDNTAPILRRYPPKKT